MGEDAVAYALKECDAKIIFTTRNLIRKVAKAAKDCPETHTVVYYQEMHRVDNDDGYAKPALEDLFSDMGKKLVSFDDVLEAEWDCKFNLVLYYL